MSKINDLDLKNWRKYSDINTDSLWLFDSRDRSQSHKGDYHGNFIPQIPNQLIRRFTKKGDVVLDTFLGSGTTLIEARRLGRYGIGIEISAKTALLAKKRINEEKLSMAMGTKVIVGDSAKGSIRRRVEKELEKLNKKATQLIILHPPYFDLLKFSEHPGDLSKGKTVKEFLVKLSKVVDNFAGLLESGRYLAVVMGDKYEKNEWVPLGFYVMEEILKRKNLKLKSIIVKNVIDNRSRKGKENLWRYRALSGGYYLFSHEYIFLFKLQKD